MNPPIAVRGERAWCRFYALDPENRGLVAASFLSTAREVGLRIAARLAGGVAVALEDGTTLRRQGDVEIPLAEEAIRYRPSYLRSPIVPLETGVGYEICVLHRDATTGALPGHWGYVVSVKDKDGDLTEPFFHRWGAVAELPALQEWASTLLKMGSRLGLVVPLITSNCQGLRIDPRQDLPDGAGWGRVLQTIVLAVG
ncbi:MAG TPA: hypothetical protein EYH30_11530 [Anaerolineales bacterium]|nr:hypothetical protein [Anaerolineae bacterium]HIQ02726.1 hypothetical protein [Anaerolineales bacterium]